jgi:hypothetical protein
LIRTTVFFILATCEIALIPRSTRHIIFQIVNLTGPIHSAAGLVLPEAGEKGVLLARKMQKMYKRQEKMNKKCFISYS